MTGKLDRMLREGRAPEVLIRRYLDGEGPNAQSAVAGYVKWELRRNGQVIKDSGGFHKNLIVNSGMNAIAATNMDTNMSSAAVGVSATAPAVTDTALGSQLGTAVTRDSFPASAYVAGPPDYWYRQSLYKFLEPNANGNLTEFGVFNGVTMFARQLLKDGTGSPTVITKTSSDQLWITYEFRIYPPTADVASVVTISGINYDVTTRAFQVDKPSAWGNYISLGETGALVVGTKESNVLLARAGVFSDYPANDGATVTNVAYAAGSFFRERQIVWDVGQANYATGIGSMAQLYGISTVTATVQMFQHAFPTTKIPKTNTKKLTLFARHSWARYP